VITFNNPPPALPSNEALATAMTLLAVAADPQGTSARLTELVEQAKVVRAAVDEHDAAAKKVQAEQAKLADLHAREKAVADKQAAVEQMQMQASVASAALREREQKVAAAEAEAAKKHTDLSVREKLLADRVASYRQALA
jgi:hypothetical protein